MARSVTARKWEIVSKDATGTIVYLDYHCPYCKMDSGKAIFIGPANMGKIDGGFETDQLCDICGKDIIVECHISGKY